MTSIFTPWGYEVDLPQNATAVPTLLSVESFNSMTGSRYASNGALSAALAAASQAVRNACGWHVSPSLACTARETASGDAVRLPSNHVTSVTSVESDGSEVDAYEWTRLGVLKAARGALSQALDGVEVAYTAGYDAAAVPDLAMTVAGIVEGVLAVAPGVASESADGVSVSYSMSASSIAASLTAQQLSALSPYRLVSSHAA